LRGKASNGWRGNAKLVADGAKQKAAFDQPDRLIVTGAARLLAAWLQWKRRYPVTPETREGAIRRASVNTNETQLVIDVLFRNGHAGLYWEAWNYDSPNTYVLDCTILHDIALNNCFLNFLSLKDCYLRGACFDNSYLMGTLFDRSDLRGSKIRTWVLSRTSFAETMLEEADLSNSKCEEAVFVRANLNKAILSGALLSGANLTDADLTDAIVTGNQWLKELREQEKPPIGVSWDDWEVYRDPNSRVPRYRLRVKE
jgi:hypothetical protein